MSKISNEIIEALERSLIENRRLLSKKLPINYCKHFIYEICPKKILMLNKEFLLDYTVENLRRRASCAEDLLNAIPRFENQNELLEYRQLYQRDYREYCAENDTLLLANGPVQSSEQFDQIYRKIRLEINELLWMVGECHWILEWIQPPYGKEKSFQQKILNEFIRLMTTISRKSQYFQQDLWSLYEKRSVQLAQVARMPQSEDIREYFRLEQDDHLFISFETIANHLQNSYGLIYKFAMNNHQSIEEIFEQAEKFSSCD